MIATIGMFDGVHRGHRFLIDFLKQHSDRNNPPIVITFSNHPLSVVDPARNPGLLLTAPDKQQRLQAQGVNCIILNFNEQLRQLTAQQFLSMLRTDYGIDTIVVGFNNRFGSDRLPFPDLKTIGNRLGIKIIDAPELNADPRPSSSAIRQLIRQGNIAQANRLLGYEYTIKGTVIGGNKIGRTLGFPTANILPSDPNIIIPAVGVYAAHALTPDGRQFNAVVNIGHRPTIETTPEIHIEAYLINFDGNLYDDTLSLRFLDRLRDEQRFPSLDALRRQISADTAYFPS